MNTEIVENPFVYLERIQIEALWDNPAINIDWKLNRNVNILAGGNGSGKTTILDIVKKSIVLGHPKNTEAEIKEWFLKLTKLRIEGTNGFLAKANREGNNVTFKVSSKNDKAGFLIHLQGLKGADTPLLSLEVVQKIANKNLKTHLDYGVYLAENLYKDYQIYLGRKYREPNAETEKLSEKINLFYSLINQHFKETGKTIDTEATGFAFKLGDKEFDFTELSSGEKQLLIIFANALEQDMRPCIFILDEPEVSLHTDWQKNLIDNILALNPNAQIIIATHSPSIIMNKWGTPDYIFQMDKITFPTLENIN